MTSDTRIRYDTDELKRLHPISEVVSSCGLELTPAGAHLYRTRCPFHEDRNPSMQIYEFDNHAHCFGCGFHGDVLDFLMRFHSLTFPEACSRLEGTVPPPPHPPRRKARESRRERRWDRLTVEEQRVMNGAMELYTEQLVDTPKAMEYLRSRGIPNDVIVGCRLGYADGYSLERYLARRGRLRVAVDLGLLSERKGQTGRKYLSRYWERFAGRVVIPEIRHGQCIWMIGRSLSGEVRAPKYVAMRGERPVLGLERAAGRELVYAVEGPFDYLTAVTWQLPAFALCGARIPGDRLGFLASARKVYGVFDGDQTGTEANERFRALLGERFVPVELPNSTDLNDLGLIPDGRERLLRLLEKR